MEFISHSPEQTEWIGEQLARQLRPGDVIAYYGGLGGRRLLLLYGRPPRTGLQRHFCLQGRRAYAHDGGSCNFSRGIAAGFVENR